MYLSDLDLAGFRAARDELFATDPQSPVHRPGFTGLRYFPDTERTPARCRCARPRRLGDRHGWPGRGTAFRRVRRGGHPVRARPCSAGRLRRWAVPAVPGRQLRPARRRLRCRALPHRPGRRAPSAGRHAARRRPGAAGLRLRVQPELRLRRPVGLPAGARARTACPSRSRPANARTSDPAHRTREGRPPATRAPSCVQRFYLRLRISSAAWGTTLNRSPTTPKSASSKIGASPSLFTATIVFEVCMPARCWIAPEMPSAT